MSEIHIGVFYDWPGTGPEAQWPSMPPQRYENVRFHFQKEGRYDYVFVLNDVRTTSKVTCDPANIWGFIQEPPTPFHAELQAGRPYFAEVYTTDETLTSPRYHQFNGALGWGVGCSYDELVAEPYPLKSVDLAWVTSNSTWLPGHKQRMAFLEALRRAVPDLELYGRGIKPIARKWDALSPARYTIAFENFVGGIYWSEKLTDCFLSYATPIYAGARDIDRRFPKNSYIPLDPDDPLAIDRIKDVIRSGFHEEHRAELLEARELCLNKHNTLFFLAGLAQDHRQKTGLATSPQNVRLTSRFTLGRRLRSRAHRLVVKALPPAIAKPLRYLKRRLLRQNL